MLLIVGVLVYFAIVKGFEPLLLLPIAIGMLLTNLPGGGMFHSDFWFCDITEINDLIRKANEAIYKGDIELYQNLMGDLAFYVERFHFGLHENLQGYFLGVTQITDMSQLTALTQLPAGLLAEPELLTDAYVNYSNIFQHGGLLDLLYIDEAYRGKNPL